MGGKHGTKGTPAGGSTAQTSRDQKQQQQEDLPNLDRGQLRTLIHQKLEELRSGDLYVEHDLTEKCYASLLSDKKIFSKFEDILGKTFAQIDTVSTEQRLNGGKLNKKKKSFVMAVRAETKFVREEIELYNNLSQQQGTSPDTKTNRSLDENSNRTMDSDDDDDLNENDDDLNENDDDNDGIASSNGGSQHRDRGGSNNSGKKSKKGRKRGKQKGSNTIIESANTHQRASTKEEYRNKKKKKSRRTHKAQNDSDEDLSDSDQDAKMGKGNNASLEERLERAKIDFETKKKEILDSIDTKTKKDFRSVGFGKWNKDWIPIIQCSPYDVHPGAVREEYFLMLQSKKNAPDRLVYWYGTHHDDLSFAYSMLPKSQIKSYDAGKKAGLDVLKKATQTKVNKKKKLNQTEQLIVDGLKELEEEATKEKNDRLSWISFEEDYVEEVKTQADLDMDEVEDLVVQKKKNTRKRGIDSVVSDVGGEEIPTSKPTPKKKKAKKNKNRINDDGDDQITKSAKKQKVESSSKKASKHKNIIGKEEDEEQPKSKRRKEEDTKAVEEVDKVLEEEILSDESADGDFSNNESESEDEFYSSKSKAKQKTANKSKNIPKETNIAGAEKSVERKKIKKKPNKKKCQEMFQECEEKFLPIMDKLNSTASNKEKTKCLKAIEVDVNLITPSFVREYKIGLTIGQVRKKTESSEDVKQLCKTVTKLLKQVYSENTRDELEGFEPKKKSESKPAKKEKLPTQKKEEKLKIAIQKKEVASENIDVPISKKNPTIGDNIQKQRNNVAEKNIKVEREPIVRVEKSKPMFSLIKNIRDSKSTTISKENKFTKDLSQVKSENTLPAWITSNPPDDKSYLNNSDRNFAMTFFDDALVGLPKEKVNPITIARSLEEAAFEKFKADMPSYWEKVHDICAAISGKEHLGSLGQNIVDGKYPTPSDVLEIPRKKLFQSFEGYSMS